MLRLKLGDGVMLLFFILLKILPVLIHAFMEIAFRRTVCVEMATVESTAMKVRKESCVNDCDHCFCAVSCSPPCQNEGSCVAPNLCSCPVGWRGPTCSQGIFDVFYLILVIQ